MTEQSPNDLFKDSSFLQGHNALYVEQLYARYENDPSSVDDAWAAFFRSLNDEAGAARAEAAGPSWARADWPPTPGGDLVAALEADTVPPRQAAL